MRGTTITAAAAALFASTVSAGGKAIVHNKCSFPVYAWAIDASDCVDGAIARNPLEPKVLAPGSSYKEHMRELLTGGVSIKLSNKPSLWGAITQFEYTKNYDTWYDISNVNCDGAECPFAPHGMYMQSGPGCPTVTCSAADELCHGAYNNPHDDWASLCCPDGDPDVAIYLCAESADDSAPAPPPSTPSSYSSYSAPSTYASVEEAAVTPKPKVHRPKPTPVDPVTQIYEVTEVSTVVVTVTPTPGHARRHVHHPHGHHH